MSTAGRTATAGIGGLVALVLAPVLMSGLLIGGISATTPASSTIDTTQLPASSTKLVPELDRILQTSCPQLPLRWAAAHIHAESSWDPNAYNPDGPAAGLYQFQEATWTSAGGNPWSATPPPADADIFDPVHHLEIAVPWLCTNLRHVHAHLAKTGKPTDPLDALLVCHIAGCSRVIQSATGIPTSGEAGCDNHCARTIDRYIAAVDAHAQRFTAAPTHASLHGPAAPAPFTGSSTTCTDDDPSGNGCLTPATRHALDQILVAFDGPGPDAPVRSFTCWDEHAWNPTSDHPHGRACDFFPAQPGKFPTGTDLSNGWRLAEWLRAHAEPLRVRYIIWQGRFWSPNTQDDNGWGSPYSGGGVYDTRDATGGHYDHIHLSIAT